MIGTSDGEQFKDSMAATLAAGPPSTPTTSARMALGATEKPAGALIEAGGYGGSGATKDQSRVPSGERPRLENLPSQFPVAPPPDAFHKDLPAPVQRVLSQPHIAEAIQNPKIDRTHEVPYVAGASSKPDDYTTHVDKSVPSSVTLSGQTFDPAIPLNIHEQVEKSVMEELKKRGMKDEKAYEIAHHEFAEPAEDAWYKHNGIDIAEVNKWWSKIDQKTEKDTGDFPPTLYKAPYPHDKVEGVKHEPTNVNAEWATSVPLPAARPGEAPISNPILDGKYDKLPMSDNVEDRRQEIANMARNSKSIEDLINQITDMVHIADPEEREKYFKEGIKNSDMDNPIGRKAGIVDLLHQLRVLNTMERSTPNDPQWLKDQEIKVYDSTGKHQK